MIALWKIPKSFRQTKLESFRVCMTSLRSYKSLQNTASRANSLKLLPLRLYAQGRARSPNFSMKKMKPMTIHRFRVSIEPWFEATTRRDELHFVSTLSRSDFRRLSLKSRWISASSGSCLRRTSFNGNRSAGTPILWCRNIGGKERGRTLNRINIAKSELIERENGTYYLLLRSSPILQITTN